MTKQEAYEAMLQGSKVAHDYYSPEEYLFINSDGLFETEDGCVHGTIHDEFWTVYQKWYDGWEVLKNTLNDGCTDAVHLIRNIHHDYTPTYIVRYPNERYVSKNSHKRTNKRKRR